MFTQSRDVFRRYTDPESFDRIAEFGTVSEMWNRCLRDYPDTPAVADDDAAMTYAQLEDAAASFRAVLCPGGALPEGRVGILSANSRDFVKAFLAVATLGLTAVILPAQLDTPTVFGCCMKFGIRTLVYQPELAARLELVSARAPQVRQISLTETSGERLAARACSPDDPCVVMFTGGTTGRSKGALLSNRAVLQGTINGCYGYHDVFGQRYLLVLPLSHVFGLVRNLMTSLYTGSTLFLCRNNKDMFRNAAQFQPTVFVAVPALVELGLTLSRKFGRSMLGPDLKYIICGAAAVAPYLITEYAKLGVTVFPGYGLTESANLVSGNPECIEKPESVGIPYPHQELRIENGELWLRGDNMMTAYLGEETSGFDGDGWFHTGDLARLDDDGFLYLTGRIKEIIVLSNGENVSPAQVEARFNELPFVQDSQVFEDVTEQGTHILALEIVPRATELAAQKLQDPQTYMLEELQRVNLALPSYQRVSRMTIRDRDFDRTPSMKIVRYQKCK